jgi:Ala-tRNA(Pro) deacylase
MAMSMTLRDYLQDAGIAYDVISHPRQYTSLNVAETAHISGDRLAKAVLLHHDDGYLLAVLPSTHRVDLDRLERIIDSPCDLATEDELESLFDDCEPGAAPPIGAAYGMEVIVDSSLDTQPDVYFEAGDHRCLVHMSKGDFNALLPEAGHAAFSRHV